MDYPRIYAEFIRDRRRKEVGTVLSNAYTEKHHILPRAKGGDDSAENLIHLTPEDHFFAHLLLAKIHGGKMWQALMIMSRRPKGRDRSEGFIQRARKTYGAAKRNAVPAYVADMKRRIAEGTGPMSSAEARAKVSAALKGRTFSGDTRAKISAAKAGLKRSAESVEKQRATLTGGKLSPEHIASISKALRGRVFSDAHRANMSAVRKGIKFSPERCEIAKQASARRVNKQPFLGGVHSEETKKRMAAVYEAKREYQRLYGVSPKVVTLAMINLAGIRIKVPCA